MKKIAVDAKCIYTKVQVNDLLYVGLMQQLIREPCRYPIRRCAMSSMQRLNGVSTISDQLVVNSQLPTHVYLMIIPSVNVHGIYNII